MKHTSLFLVAAVALSWGLPLAGAADYQFIGADLNVRWNNTTAANWNQTAPWAGTPSAPGPGAGDHLDLASDGSLTLIGSSSGTFLRELAGLTTSGASGMTALRGWADSTTTLKVSGNIEVNSGRGLRLWDGGSTSNLTVLAEGNIEVGSGSVLTLGNINAPGAGQNANERLAAFTVTGSTLVSGALINSGGNNTTNGANTNALGDLVVNTGGSVIGSAGGDGGTTTGIRTYHLNARSLSGGGTLSASSMTQLGTRDVNLNLATLAATATTFSGVLRDSTVASSGTNRLHLVVSGSGRQTLSGANTYTGQTRVKTGGTLLVNGTHLQATNGVGGGSATDGLYHVESTATLGGSGGRIAGRSTANNTNLVYVASGGTLAPGGSGLVLDGGNLTGANARHLRLDTGAEVAFTLAADGSSASYLALWNYAGANDVVFNNNVVNLTLEGGLVEGTYTVSLVNFYTDAGDTDALSGLTNGLTLTGGLLDARITSAELLFNATNISLQYTVVPEPAAGVLGLFGLGAWVFVRRARSRK